MAADHSKNPGDEADQQINENATTDSKESNKSENQGARNVTRKLTNERNKPLFEKKVEIQSAPIRSDLLHPELKI